MNPFIYSRYVMQLSSSDPMTQLSNLWSWSIFDFMFSFHTAGYDLHRGSSAR